MSGLEIVRTPSANDSVAGKSATATCPAGKRVVGGGADIDGTTEAGGVESNPDVFLTDSQPVGGGAWQGVAREDDPGYERNWHIDAYAICAIVA